MSLNALLNDTSAGKLKEQNTSYCDPYSMVLLNICFLNTVESSKFKNKISYLSNF